MQNDNLFSERLTELMLENSLSAKQLGAEVGVNDETVRLWKNGQRLILLPQLVRLADYFNCSIDYLVGRTEVFLGYKICPLPPFYERLKYVMNEKQVSRYALVKNLNIYDSYFTNWKQGKRPNLVTLLVIADFFGVSVDYLVGREQ